MTETKPRAIIVHGHIFKNAGTSFDWALKRNFDDGFLDHPDDREMKRGSGAYLTKLINENPALKAIASHHLYKWMPLPQPPMVTIIPCFLLRHPIERVRSVYTFERNQKSDTPGAIYAKKLNFTDYIQWRMDHRGGGVVMNYQMKYCSGRKGGGIDDALISKTASYMSSAALTGIVDRFDESMVYFEEILNKSFPQIDLSYVRQNVSRRLNHPISVDDKAAAILKELGSCGITLEENNRADLELYALANKSLDGYIGQINNFDKKLDEFRRRCSKLDGQS